MDVRIQAIESHQWAQTKRPHCRITGEVNGRAPIDPTGPAHISDRVAIVLLTESAGMRIGDITIVNHERVIDAIQPSVQGCLKPERSGHVEFYTLETSGVALLPGGAFPSGAARPRASASGLRRRQASLPKYFMNCTRS